MAWSQDSGRPVGRMVWRDWLLSWQWLLLATEPKAGKVVALSGFGRAPCGMIDYRMNMSTGEAKKAGVNTLLALRAMELGSAAGHSAVNWCGSNRFKRDLGGDPVPVWRWVGGGPGWGMIESARAGLFNLARRAKKGTRRS